MRKKTRIKRHPSAGDPKKTGKLEKFSHESSESGSPGAASAAERIFSIFLVSHAGANPELTWAR